MKTDNQNEIEMYQVSPAMQALANGIVAGMIMHCYCGYDDRIVTAEEQEAMREKALAFYAEEVEKFADEFAVDSSEDERNKVKEYLRRKVLATTLDDGMIVFNNVKNDL